MTRIVVKNAKCLVVQFDKRAFVTHQLRATNCFFFYCKLTLYQKRNLTLHLKRFRVEARGGKIKQTKLDTTVSFPARLDLSPFMDTSQKESNNANDDDEKDDTEAEKATQKEKDEEKSSTIVPIYDLVGVVTHSGATTRSGHCKNFFFFF